MIHFVYSHPGGKRELITPSFNLVKVQFSQCTVVVFLYCNILPQVIEQSLFLFTFSILLFFYFFAGPALVGDPGIPGHLRRILDKGPGHGEGPVRAAIRGTDHRGHLAGDDFFPMLFCSIIARWT